MNIKDITASERKEFNEVISHPLQSYEWGEFREKTGVTVIRKGFYKNHKLVDGFQLTLHRIPHTKLNIGYLPKGNMPTPELLEELKRVGQENNCIFIQLEPNVLQSSQFSTHSSQLGLTPSAHPLFTKYTFVLDISKSEEELLKNMHPKTRYNIRVAEKHDVTVKEDDSEKAFEEYLKLTYETTTRQKFYAHSQNYHVVQWQTLPHKILNHKSLILNQLSSHLLTANYQTKTLVAWIVFVFKDTLYYPYGASSNENREVMASNGMMWETIKFGKKLGLKKFDMWGALGPDPDIKDPWFGFHRFKQGYGAIHTEFVGSYDLVINPLMYQLYKGANVLRWMYLRIKK